MSDRATHWQRVVDAVQAVRRLPSLSAGVMVDGELAWTGSSGAGGGADVQYRIGSITKVMSAILVMQCRDEGLLSIDDRLERWIPESAYASVSLRHLLSHAGGIASEPVGSWWERSPGRPIESVIADNDERTELAGTGFHYSNTGYALLGEVVARVRGMAWADQVRERIWEPLGMADTSLLPGPDAAHGWSVHHLRGTLTPEPATDTLGMAPAGQVWSTVRDLARFARFLASGDDDVLGAGTLAEMAIPVMPGSNYGLGLMNHGGLVGHLGSMPGFQASCFASPSTGSGVIGLTNGTTGFTGVDFTQRMLGKVTPGAGEPWVSARDVPGWAERLLGYWHWGNSAFEVRWHNERLEFHDLARGLLAEQFVADDAGIIGWAGYHRGERLHVVENSDGSINHLRCATFIYTRVPYDPAAPIPGGVPG